MVSPATLLGAVLDVGAEALLPVDYPDESSDAAVAGLAATTLTDAHRRATAQGNARRLLRLLAR